MYLRRILRVLLFRATSASTTCLNEHIFVIKADPWLTIALDIVKPVVAETHFLITSIGNYSSMSLH